MARFLFLIVLMNFPLGLMAQEGNDTTQKEIEVPTCTELLPPETSEAVIALQACLHIKKIAEEQRRRQKKIQNSVQGDEKLRESTVGPFCLFDRERNRCGHIPAAPPVN